MKPRLGDLGARGQQSDELLCQLHGILLHVAGRAAWRRCWRDRRAPDSSAARCGLSTAGVRRELAHRVLKLLLEDVFRVGHQSNSMGSTSRCQRTSRAAFAKRLAGQSREIVLQRWTRGGLHHQLRALVPGEPGDDVRHRIVDAHLVGRRHACRRLAQKAPSPARASSPPRAARPRRRRAGIPQRVAPRAANRRTRRSRGAPARRRADVRDSGSAPAPRPAWRGGRRGPPPALAPRTDARARDSRSRGARCPHSAPRPASGPGSRGLWRAAGCRPGCRLRRGESPRACATATPRLRALSRSMRTMPASG
mgnify:CR=1 FL=1